MQEKNEVGQHGQRIPAVALDWDPAHNQLNWGRGRASLAASSYDFWWQAWEEEGWVSLGRSRNYDWMHVQAARL